MGLEQRIQESKSNRTMSGSCCDDDRQIRDSQVDKSDDS